MIREGNATPAWLANDFNASRRHALIVAQVIKLGQNLTDDAVSMFIKLMGRLFSQANNRKKQRHMDCRPDTAKALRMFLDTITAPAVRQRVWSERVGGSRPEGRLAPAAPHEA